MSIIFSKQFRAIQHKSERQSYPLRNVILKCKTSCVFYKKTMINAINNSNHRLFATKGIKSVSI